LTLKRFGKADRGKHDPVPELRTGLCKLVRGTNLIGEWNPEIAHAEVTEANMPQPPEIHQGMLKSDIIRSIVKALTTIKSSAAA